MYIHTHTCSLLIGGCCVISIGGLWGPSSSIEPLSEKLLDKEVSKLSEADLSDRIGDADAGMLLALFALSLCHFASISATIAPCLLPFCMRLPFSRQRLCVCGCMYVWMYIKQCISLCHFASILATPHCAVSVAFLHASAFFVPVCVCMYICVCMYTRACLLPFVHMFRCACTCVCMYGCI